MTGRDEEESKEEIGPRKNPELIYRKSSKDLKPI